MDAVLLSLKTHYENFEMLPFDVIFVFMEDLQQTIKVIKNVTGVERVNFYILGNAASSMFMLTLFLVTLMLNSFLINLFRGMTRGF